VVPVGYAVLALLLLGLVVLTIRRATLRRARRSP
jgi:nitrate reductase gamma subunit